MSQLPTKDDAKDTSEQVFETASSGAGQAQLSDIQDLYDLFGETAPVTRRVLADRLPQPERSLLAHHNHMTVTLESHHRTRSRLAVLQETETTASGSQHSYARKILLLHGDSDQVLQFGLMQIDLSCVPASARQRILAKRAPLGRVLIEEGVLRRITTHALLEIEPDSEIQRWFGLSEASPRPVYGRLATLFCDEQPAIDLLELVAPTRSL